jgi:hypothetical protein
MSSSVSIDASSDRVWDLIARASRWPEWSQVCREVWDAPDDDDWRVGHDFGFKLRMANRNVPFNVTVSRIEPVKVIEWRSTKFTITAIRTISVESTAGRTQVTDSKAFSSPHLPIALAYPRWLIRRMTESWLSEMKQEAESK